MNKLKKIFITLLILLVIVIIYSYDYHFNHSTVTVYISNDTELKTYRVRNGKTLKKLENPTKEDYVFVGWSILNTNEPFDTTTIVNDDIVIYANWATITYEE